MKKAVVRQGIDIDLLAIGQQALDSLVSLDVGALGRSRIMVSIYSLHERLSCLAHVEYYAFRHKALENVARGRGLRKGEFYTIL